MGAIESVRRGSRSAHRGAVVLALAVLTLAAARDADSAQLQSLQRGTVTVSNGLPLVVLLPTAVDLTRAFLVFGASEATGDPLDGQVSGQLTAPTAVTFQQLGGPGSVTIKYYVAEFASGVSVQRGSIDNSSGNVFDVTLATAVDTARSFPLISFRSQGVNFNCNDFVRAKITSSTNLQLSSDVSCGAVGASVVDWQVVEYQDANVQSGDLSLAAADAGGTATLAPVVDPAKSWLIYSYEVSPVSIPDVGQYLVRGLLTDSTTLTFDRNNSGTVGITLTWYLVEFTDATTVQSASQAFLTADTAIDVTLPLPVPVGTSMAAGGGDYQRGGRSPHSTDDVVGVGWFNFDLTTSTNLRITRGAGGLAPADVGWFVLTFAAAPTAVKLQSFTATPGDGSVGLDWRTGSELENLGFHLYRSLAENGPWERLTASLIPGLGSSALGQAYTYRDAGLTNGTRYYYRLEDVDASSKATSHGPVSAVPAAGAAVASVPPDEAESRTATTSCPAWVVSASSAQARSSSSAPLVCTRYGDPDAVSLAVVSRDSRSAVLELRTGGFWALHAPSGRVRLFVPGFDDPEDPRAGAVPFRRVLVEAVVGRRAQLGRVRALEQVSFGGLEPALLGQSEMQVSLDGTLRARRRELREPSPAHFAVKLAELLPSVFQGETKSAVAALHPLRYDARRRRLVLSKRLVVQLRFTARELGEHGRGSVGRRQPRPCQPQASREVLARLYTSGRGLYAVPFEQLFPRRSDGVVASQLRLERQGVAVAFHVDPHATSIGPGSRLLFYADVSAESSAFSPETAWELVAASGLAMPLASAAPVGPALRTAPTGRASFEVNRLYQPGLLEAQDLWLWDAAATGVTRTLPFTLADVDPASAASSVLEVYLQGGSESGQALDHHVRISLNGVAVGEATFAGKVAQRTSLSVPAGVLREGANELALANVADTGVTSVVFLDRFALSYPRRPAFGAGVFAGTWDGSGVVTVAGAGGAGILLDTTSADVAGGAPIWLNRFEATGGALRFRAAAGRRYLAVSPQALLTPRVVTPAASTLRRTANQADYLMIGPREFLSAAEPLRARREAQGLKAEAVAFEEIANEFGHGQPSAEAIRAFLAHAFQSWARPSPRYVLLLGDASYDPRNFTGVAQPAPLPALWARTSYLWTVSDPLLAAVNGEDELPDLAIGRLPATTLEQVQALVDKLLAWEDTGQALGGLAALVADNPDLGGDFDADIDAIAAGPLAGRPLTRLKLSELGGAMRPAIREALDGGLSLLSYVGHGGAAVWASENVWNSWDAASLRAQSEQPLLLALNCLNGYFVAPSFDSLAESLVKAEGRGAVAAVSPSGMSLDGPAHLLHRALVAELVSGGHERLGDAVLAAQASYARSGVMPELLSVYQLLGDPAMPIR